MLARREHLFGNASAGLERAARQRDLAPRPCHREFERALRLASMMNPRSAPGHLDGGIEHERQHVVEHAARAERTKAVEQRRHLPQFGGSVDGALLCRRRVVADREHDVDVGRLSEPNVVSRLQCARVDLLVVDERAETDCRSWRTNPSPCLTISAWSRDTSAPARRRSLSLRRPIENTGLSIGTIRRPSVSVIINRGWFVPGV